MKHMRLICLMMTLCLMAGLLAGCGSSDTKEDTSVPSQNTEVSKEESSEIKEEVKEESSEAEVQEETSEETEEVKEEKVYDAEYGFIYFEVDGYAFSLKDDIEEIIKNIGEPVDTLVTSSCAYQGDDYIFYFDGFEFVGNTDEEGVNRITSITLDDDSVSTPQGVKIGMPIDEALELMGETYEKNNSIYTFSYGFAMMRIQAGSDNCVKAIQYMLVLQ